MADAYLGAGFSLETRQHLAIWFDSEPCPPLRPPVGDIRLWAQTLLEQDIPVEAVERMVHSAKAGQPCPHEDAPECRCPWIADLARAADVYAATRPTAADDEQLRTWLGGVQAWALRGIELLRDHADAIGATQLDMALLARGWSGQTVRRQLADVARVVDDAIGVRGNAAGVGLWPPEPGRGNPDHRPAARAALRALVAEVVAIADRCPGVTPAGLEKILALVLREIGEPREERTVRELITEARSSP